VGRILGYASRSFVAGDLESRPYCTEGVEGHPWLATRCPLRDGLTAVVSRGWQRATRQAWAAEQRAVLIEQRAVFAAQLACNATAAADPDLHWLVRLCALAATDDVAGLDQACTAQAPGLTSHLTTAAEVVYQVGQYDILENDSLPFWETEPGLVAHGIPLFEHPLRVFELYGSPGDPAGLPEAHHVVLAACAVNAAVAGAEAAVEYLILKDEALRLEAGFEVNCAWSLWSFPLTFEKGGCAFQAVVEHACNRPALGEPVRGLAALLAPARGALAPAAQQRHGAGEQQHLAAGGREEHIRLTLQSRCPASQGSALHVAAAHGHTALVTVLLDSGFDPAHRMADERFHDEYSGKAAAASASTTTAG
jgi:hypothetical protein